ncbi:MAG: hypothetical protein M0018_09465 [Nitrospiraceae bacterium]|nr:hypothetical protein [Nitrospiraceae bacterium]
MMQPSEIIAKLRKEYIARQNKGGRDFFLNLGGPKSAINGDDFKGLVLFNLPENFIFGAYPEDIKEFRDKVMEKRGGYWIRRADVPGRSNDDVSITVSFDESCTRVVCKTKQGPIYICAVRT